MCSPTQIILAIIIVIIILIIFSILRKKESFTGNTEFYNSVEEAKDQLIYVLEQIYEKTQDINDIIKNFSKDEDFDKSCYEISKERITRINTSVSNIREPISILLESLKNTKILKNKGILNLRPNYCALRLVYFNLLDNGRTFLETAKQYKQLANNISVSMMGNISSHSEPNCQKLVDNLNTLGEYIYLLNRKIHFLGSAMLLE